MLGRAIGCVCWSLTVAFGRPPVGAAPGAETIGPVPVPATRGAAGMGLRGTVFARGAVAAPVSIFGGPPGAGGRGIDGGEGGAMGTVAAGGAPGTDGRAMPGGGGTALGAGGADGATGGGSFTGEVEALGAGGGSGAEGSWIGAVAFLGADGAGIATPEVTGLTGEVASRGCTEPSPGRARSVMRTVSFLSGTAEVFGELGGGGVGRFSDSLMGEKEGGKISRN